jgi:hypothetical protein
MSEIDSYLSAAVVFFDYLFGVIANSPKLNQAYTPE